MNKLLLVLVLVVVLGGGFYLLKGKSPMMEEKTESKSEAVMEEKKEAGTESAMMGDAAVKEFTVDGFEFGYDKKTITVKKGDTVKITLTSSGKMPHDWVVDEFNARTEKIKAGETDTIEFVADKAGEFEYYCSVGQHRANGMVGKLIVE